MISILHYSYQLCRGVKTQEWNSVFAILSCLLLQKSKPRACSARTGTASENSANEHGLDHRHRLILALRLLFYQEMNNDISISFRRQCCINLHLERERVPFHRVLQPCRPALFVLSSTKRDARLLPAVSWHIRMPH